MNSIKIVLAGAAVVAVGLSAAVPQAQAGGAISFSYNSGGYGYGPGYGYSPGYGGYGGGYGGGYVGRPYGFSGYRGGYGHTDVYHDTSHYDYHPGGVVPHGNHLHSIPGHYDYHPSGHVDHVSPYGVRHGGGHRHGW